MLFGTSNEGSRGGQGIRLAPDRRNAWAWGGQGVRLASGRRNAWEWGGQDIRLASGRRNACGITGEHEEERFWGRKRRWYLNGSQRSLVGLRELDSSGQGYGWVACACEHSDDPSDSLKCD
jgi:hypothetical protein